MTKDYEVYDENESGDIPVQDYFTFLDELCSESDAQNLIESFRECGVTNWREGILEATESLPEVKRHRVRKWFGLSDI